MKSDNKGFSLMELLVAMAIASIVGIAVFGFMVVGARSFQSTSADVNVQHEAQLVMNQIQDMLVDTNVGVEYTEDTEQSVLTMYNYDMADPTRHVYEVVFRSAEKKLFYNEYMPAAAEDGGTRSVGKGAVLYSEQLLGENIGSFAVDLSALEKKRVVRVDLEIKKTASDYAASSNITLRNAVKIGNSIPEYLEATPTKDPLKITGLDQFYFEPGREVDLKVLGNYRVKMEDGTDSADQDIRFFMSDRAAPVSGTSISTSGVLNISKAQKQDFYVLVTSRSGKGAPLEIKINMIVVDSVDITLTSYTKKSDGKTVTSVSDYEFEAGDNFTLNAEVKGRNLDKADVPMYGITWALGTGSDAYATIGDVRAAANGSSCVVTMKNDMKVQSKNGKDPFTVTATSVRSTQIPYYSGTKKTPVVGVFQAFAHQASADFKIAGKAKLLRGKHDNSMNVSIVNDIVDAIPGFDRNKHTLFAKVSVNELLYHQEENAVSSTYTIRRDVTDAPGRFQGEGVALGIFTPDIDKANPNITYEYEITFYIFEKTAGGPSWETLRVMGPGETSKDGYNLADAKYQSNTIVQQSERLFLFYNRITYDTNEDGSTNGSSWTGDYTAKATPRITKDYLNGSGQMNDTVDTWIPVYSCANVEANGITNRMSQTDGFRIYYQKDGSWVEFDESRRIQKNGENYPNLANCLEARYEGNNLRLIYYPKRWSDDVPQMVRVVPCLKYTPPGESSQQDGILFDDYCEVYLWNIEVPTVKEYQTGIKKNAISTIKYSRLYFPSPLDPMFTDIAKNEYKIWKYAYPPNVQGKEGEIQNIELNYKLSYNADGYGNKTWYLHLRYYDQGKYKNLGVYTCKDTEQNWTMIENDQIPDNLAFELK